MVRAYGYYNYYKSCNKILKITTSVKMFLKAIKKKLLKKSLMKIVENAFVKFL